MAWVWFGMEDHDCGLHDYFIHRSTEMAEERQGTLAEEAWHGIYEFYSIGFGRMVSNCLGYKRFLWTMNTFYFFCTISFHGLQRRELLQFVAFRSQDE